MMSLIPTAVTAGLVPAIHVFPCDAKDVDGRDKPGHDDGEGGALRGFSMAREDALGSGARL
jgi:hypothetical protein